MGLLTDGMHDIVENLIRLASEVLVHCFKGGQVFSLNGSCVPQAETRLTFRFYYPLVLFIADDINSISRIDLRGQTSNTKRALLQSGFATDAEQHFFALYLNISL
jgi:hypothetical protein